MGVYGDLTNGINNISIKNKMYVGFIIIGSLK